MFWQSGWGQLLIGVLANLVFILVLTGALGFYIRMAIARRHRPLRALLATADDTPIKIMISNMYVQQGGALGVMTKRSGFFGSVASEIEYVSALELAERIRSRPVARTLRALLDQVGLADSGPSKPLDCTIMFSPSHIGDTDDPPVGAGDYEPADFLGDTDDARRVGDAFRERGTYILIGGPTHNVAVYYVLNHIQFRRFAFDVDPDDALHRNTKLRVLSYDHRGLPHTYPEKDDEDSYFIVQKIPNFGPSRVTVFVCAGLSSMGTALAVATLATRWRELHRDYPAPQKNFALLYRHSATRRDRRKPILKDVLDNLDSAQLVWRHPAPEGTR